jgi:hypothetical protein
MAIARRARREGKKLRPRYLAAAGFLLFFTGVLPFWVS